MWDRQRTFTTLKAWATALHPDCECSAELKPAIAEIAKPRVTFAPALILGKRTQIGMVRIYDAIINRVASGDEDIPAAWTGLADANPGEHRGSHQAEEEFSFTGGGGPTAMPSPTTARAAPRAAFRRALCTIDGCRRRSWGRCRA